jgi:hypothetical protein
LLTLLLLLLLQQRLPLCQAEVLIPCITQGRSIRTLAAKSNSSSRRLRWPCPMALQGG